MMDAVCRTRAWRWGVGYQYMFLDSSGEDLTEIARYANEGKLRAVVGSKANLNDLDGVKRIAGQAHAGKGGLGKSIIEVR